MFPDEQRGGGRVSCSARFLGASDKMLKGEVLDISGTGLRLLANGLVKKGLSLHLDFMLPGGRVEAVGEVRWVKKTPEGSDCGIRFVRISSEALKVIEATQAAPPK
jgi:hypothetical protein